MAKAEFTDLDEIIAKSLLGDLTDDAQKELDSWVNSSAKNQEVYEHLKLFYRTKYEEPRYINASILKERIIKEGFQGTKRKSVHWSWTNHLVKVAAILILIFSVVLIVHQYQEVDKDQKPSVVRVEKYNPSGVKSRIVLTDGSVVWLNAESKLVYNRGFSSKERFIELEGEAYFEVQKDPDRPFIVKTGDIVTQALGTSFNIRYYPEESQTGVSLITGKVSVKSQNNEQQQVYYLSPNEQLNISRDLNNVYMSNFDTEEVALWKENILKFSNASFDEVIRGLERWYGVEIDASAYDLKDWDYVGEFANQSLEQVLSRIAYAQHFNFEINEDQIKLFNQKKN